MEFTNSSIENIVHHYYELTVEAKALDGYDENDYYPQEFLEIGTPYMKSYSIEGGER